MHSKKKKTTIKTQSSSQGWVCVTEQKVSLLLNGKHSRSIPRKTTRLHRNALESIRVGEPRCSDQHLICFASFAESMCKWTFLDGVVPKYDCKGFLVRKILFETQIRELLCH